MIYEILTDKSYEEICSKVEDVCKKQGFGVMKVYNFTEILKEKGFPIEKEITTYEICQPKVASEVLTKESSIAPFMPCKITVEKTEKGTKISTVLPTEILRTFGIGSVKDLAKKIDSDIKAIIDNIVS